MIESPLLRSAHETFAPSGTRALRVGLLGLGVVGSGVVKILEAIHAPVFAQHGIRVELAAVAVRHPDKPRAVEVPRALLTTDPWSIVDDPSIDLVIEVIGGANPAAALIAHALRTGHHVISANKLVLSNALSAFHALARENNARLLYEASVCGSVPVLRSIDQLRRGDVITSLRGIVNGSTNYVLTAMSERGIEYDEAIDEARIAGFLEADPSLDVSGADAAQKLSILAYHAFGVEVAPHEIGTTGITVISKSDIDAAKRSGCVIKLIASAEYDAATRHVVARVRPEEMRAGHMFADTRNEFNAIELQTLYAGPQLLRGKGAGSLPTASAIVGDLMEIVSARKY